LSLSNDILVSKFAFTFNLYRYNVRAYPHVLFGTAAQFKLKTKAATSGLEALTPFTPRTAERMVEMVGERTGAATHKLAPQSAQQSSGNDDGTNANNPTPPSSNEVVAAAAAAAASDPNAADLEDIEHATVLAFEQMSSPALLVPESRGAFLEFTKLLAVAHPLRACKQGAQELVTAFQAVWPEHGKDLAEVQRNLANFRVCGDGHKAPLTWRACAGSEEGKRGYTCGLWWGCTS
jgi:thiol oxidase